MHCGMIQAVKAAVGAGRREGEAAEDQSARSGQAEGIGLGVEAQGDDRRSPRPALSPIRVATSRSLVPCRFGLVSVAVCSL